MRKQVSTGVTRPHQVPQRPTGNPKMFVGVEAYSWMVHISKSFVGSTTVAL